MGWLYRDEPIDDPLAYLKCQIQLRLRDPHAGPDARRRPRPQYGLPRGAIDREKDRPSFVFATIILISNTRKWGFGYKDQDEAMGPCQCDCPLRIIRLLSPIADLPHAGYTTEWRARVAAYHDPQRQRRQRRKSLSVGSIVTLPAATRFSGGIAASSFRVAYFRRRTPIFEALDRPGFYCRLRGATLAIASIAEPHTAEPAPAGG